MASNKTRSSTSASASRDPTASRELGEAGGPAERPQSTAARTSRAQGSTKPPARGQLARGTKTAVSDEWEKSKKSSPKTAAEERAQSGPARSRKPAQVLVQSANRKPQPSPVVNSAPSSSVSVLKAKGGEFGKMDQSKVKAIEQETRGQRENPLWFQHRQNRITASVAHRVAHCHFVNGSSQEPPRSYLQQVTGSSSGIRTRAMSWGIEQESVAVQSYQKKKSLERGKAVRVQECGLFIDPQHAWLAASPDGIVLDAETGEKLACLEIKCPYKHRDNSISQACQDRDFCLEPHGDGYRLKTNHSYYTQVQCQMAMTGLQTTDFVVFTRRETAISPVDFNPKFWNNTVAKLEKFYTSAVIPYLQEKGKAAAAIPEE
ncbi:uncharacterized protein LOC136753175 [Amia ocellicauda]|uniref:uncharacterized protein LOC136753175 n=1 Tax=Amia ocellicauda TaxID=2972642 RepID=UPI003463F126